MIKEKYNSFKKKLSFLKWIDPFTYVDIVLNKVHPKKPNSSFADEAIDSIVYIFSALIFAFLLYSILGFLLNTSSPMVIVSSASMVPEIFRGDIIVLYGAEKINAVEVNYDKSLQGKMYLEYGETFPEPVEKYIDPLTSQIVVEINKAEQLEINNQIIPVAEEGDIIVYYSEYSNKEIIHRAIARIIAVDGVFLLTKGDANPSIDQQCVPLNLPSGQTIYVACITKKPVPENQVIGKQILRIPAVGCLKIWVFDNLPSLILTGSLPSDFYGLC